MIIQTRFTNRYHARILRQLAQGRNYILSRFLDIRRMNADYREDIWIFLGQGDRAPAAFDRSPDCDDAGNAGIGGAPQDVVEVCREIRVVEMGVGLDQLRVES